MNKSEVLEEIGKLGIIPVIRTKSAEEARTVIKAIIKGGINILEITMTIPNAVELIEKISQELKDTAIIGAGTVLDVETAQKCVEAGAKFIVSPIFDVKIVSFCNRSSIPVMPGALTPTEIFNAWQKGADLVKVFPVSVIGGVLYLKAIKSVFPQIMLIPTGGVNLENAVDFLQAGAVAVGIGSELTTGKPSVITKQAENLCRQLK